jgi:hypothetical protein
VTRGTRPKKPSSSRGFARKARQARRARGARGSRGLKTENRNFFSLFRSWQQLPIFFIIVIIFLVSASAFVWTADRVRRGWGREGEGGNESVRADAGLHPCGRIFTSADGKNCLRVKSHLRGKRGRAWTFGRLILPKNVR